ncbi:site-specific integrase [Brevibacterium linens]|uniref:site-specific integrase n=1 Tax=Brevibacterium linens TaxID=1703 RepID=UPI000FCC8EA2|nr:tyrosine-type recombinase/integrase [Brevibacterium linens]AZU01070.1 site-specific integrase [Brevibacterium linens]
MSAPESLPTFPPIGVKVSTDVEQRASGVRARARWTDPATKKRITRALVVPDEEAADAFFDQLQRSAKVGVELTITLSDYIEQIGDSWKRGLDPTSTATGYWAGLRLRVIPAMGHVPVAGISTGMIDRTIDDWELKLSPSLIKSSVAALVRVLDEAVRDELIEKNPARNRSRRSYGKSSVFDFSSPADTSPRAHAIKDLETLTKLAEACGGAGQPYSDYVMLCALLSARSSEVAGLWVEDVNWDANIVTIRKQTFPSSSGLVTKQTKGREERPVPILRPLVPVLERLTAGKEPTDRVLIGVRGGVITTENVSRATKWDELVNEMGLPQLSRHGLRHTGATWMADAGIPLHVLQKILGHKSIDTTKGYLHPDLGHIAKAGELANRFLDAQAEAPERPSGKRRGKPKPGPDERGL